MQDFMLEVPACTLPGVEPLAGEILEATWGCCKAIQRSKAAHGLLWGGTDMLQSRWFTLMKSGLIPGLVELVLRHTKVSCQAHAASLS